MSERDEYFESARTWAGGQLKTAERQTRIAWRVAAGAGAIAVLLAVTLMLLVPLKSVQPYVLTVDRQTGSVEAATSLNSGRLTQNEAVIQAQLAGYVIARETFDSTDLAQQYRRVQVTSSPPVRSAYVAQMAASNPASPLKSLNRGDTVSIEIRSVSLIADGAAMIRYTATRAAEGAGIGQSTNHVAAISFGFNGRPLRQADRYDNPLGFQVTRYRTDAEGVL